VTGSSAPTVKAALFTELETLFPDPIQVAYGDPGSDVQNQIVSVGTMRADLAMANMGRRPLRSRDETLQIDVLFSVFSGGVDIEAQQLATEAAYALLGTFMDWVATVGNETVAGSCRNAWVASHSLEEAVATNDANDPIGRLATVTAVLTTEARL
jgi:hypothetical protein